MGLIILALVIGAVIYIAIRRRKSVPVEPTQPVPEDEGKPYIRDKR